MIHRSLRLAADTIAIVVALTATCPLVASAQPVEIRQDPQVGAGHAFRRGNTCLVVTARHVVANEVADIVVLDRSGARNTAQRVYDNPTYDLALLEITGKPAIACTASWPDTAWIAGLSPQSSMLFEAVRHYPTGGRETLIALRYAGGTADTLSFAPVDRTSIRSSDSGSFVRTDGRLLGLVQRVLPESDRVEVLRLDVVDRLIGERFRGSGRAPLAIEGVSQRGRLNPQWSVHLREWVTSVVGRDVVPAQDGAARCRLAVELMSIRSVNLPNPAYKQATELNCALMKKLGRTAGEMCETNRRAQLANTPRALAGYEVSADMRLKPTSGSAVAKLVSGTVPLDAGRATRSVDEQFGALGVLMAPALQDLLGQVSCD